MTYAVAYATVRHETLALWASATDAYEHTGIHVRGEGRTGNSYPRSTVVALLRARAGDPDA